MDEEKEILKSFVSSLQTDLINSLQANGKSASGKTIKAIEVRESKEAIQLLAPRHVVLLDRGRGPTSPTGPYDKDPDGLTVLDRIKAWCKDKGIVEGAAYAITQKIHKQGYKGKPGVLTEPLSDTNINKRMDEAAGKLATLLTTQLSDLKDFYR